jgi:hypothetical protein
MLFALQTWCNDQFLVTQSKEGEEAVEIKNGSSGAGSRAVIVGTFRAPDLSMVNQCCTIGTQSHKQEQRIPTQGYIAASRAMLCGSIYSLIMLEYRMFPPSVTIRWGTFNRKALSTIRRMADSKRCSSLHVCHILRRATKRLGSRESCRPFRVRMWHRESYGIGGWR